MGKSPSRRSLSVPSTLLAAVWVMLFLSPASPAEEEHEGPEVLRARAAWFASRHLGPQGKIPPHARQQALAAQRANLASGLLGTEAPEVTGDRWVPLGPSPMNGGGQLHTGRVTAIAIHPTDPNTIYVGAAQGGVWKTTNGGTTWAPLTDAQDSLATGCITIDPTNANTIYVGTGEANGSCDSYFGAGILRSTNGGSTWTLIGTTPFDNTSVSAIVVNPTTPTTLLAANANGSSGIDCSGTFASTGIWRSTNSGSTWTRVLGPTQTGDITTEVHELIPSPTDPNKLWAGVRESGVWQTTNGGTTWTKLAGGLPASTDIGRVELAVDPSNASIVYAGFESFFGGGSYLGTWKTTNGGTTWTQLPDIPAGTCHRYTMAGLCSYTAGAGGQCGYDLFLGVAPDGNLWAGGLGYFRSADGGSTWIDICPPEVHVDQHAVAFASNGDVWIGNDGGVYETDDDGATWTSRNRGLQLGQFYPGAALHPTIPDFSIGGTQDNGTLLHDAGIEWPVEHLGDTSYGAFDPTSPNSVRYTSAIFLTIVKSTDGGRTYVDSVEGLADANTSFASFISPWAMCPSNGSVLVAGSDNAWRSNDAAAHWAANGPDPLDPSGRSATALAFSPTDATCGTYWIAIQGIGKIYRTSSGGGAWQEIGGGAFGTRTITDIAFDPVNPDVAYVAVGGIGFPAHVYKTSNATAAVPAWTAASTGIPDLPVNAVLVDPESAATIYAGSDLGVYRSTNGGSSWSAFITDHPKVAVYDLVADASSKSIVSFTHGRGAFRLANACTAPTFSGVSSAVDKGACAASGVDLAWSAPASWGSGTTGGTFSVRRFSGAECLGAFDVVAASVPGNQLAFTDVTTVGGTTYSYRVVAVNDCATPLSARGTNACSTPVADAVDQTPCPNVGNTLLGTKSPTDAQINWGSVGCGDLAGYEVYGSTTYSAPFPSGWTLLASPVPTQHLDPLGSAWVAYRVVGRDLCGNRSAD